MRRHPSRFPGVHSLLVGAAVALGVTLAAPGLAAPAFATSGFGAPVLAASAEDPTASPGTEGEEQGDPNLGPPTAGTATCTVSSTALTLATGMAATEKGILVVEGRDTTALRIFTLDSECKSTSKTYSGANPLDPQDMAVGSDGTIWVGDIGPGESERANIGVWKISPDSSTATIHRMDYPSSGKFNAEALLLDKDDLPIIISSEGGKGILYQPDKELVPDTRTNLPELKNVGEFTPQKTGTENPANIIGNAAVTGAAKSPDGSKVVIRTASDAYEFTVAEDGDIVKAITTGTPVITPLPNEPNGKAITYSVDGTGFLTLSASAKPALLSYTPFVPTAGDTGGDPNEQLPSAPSGQSWFQKLSFSELTRIVAAVGVVGLVLAIAGIVGIRRARRRRREEEEDEYDDYDEPVRGRRGRGRRDDQGFGGREAGHFDGHDQYGYADAGYDAHGYGANGYGGSYAEAGYGQQGGAAAGGYAHNGYAGADQYGGGGQYGGDQYGGGQQYGGAQPGYDPYAGQPQYGGDYGGGQQYGGGDYGAQSYGGGQQYGGDYGGGQYGAQPYGGQQGGQQYGGGYDDDFDPMQDPRRR